MLHCKSFAGAAHASHDFVRDQKNAALAANLGDARDVTFRRHNRAESCSYNWLENKSGGGVCIVFDKRESRSSAQAR